MPILNVESAYTLPPERKIPADSREPLPEDWLLRIPTMLITDSERC